MNGSGSDQAAAIGKAARNAANDIQLVSSDEKNDALFAIKATLTKLKQEILQANKLDLQAAEEQVKTGAMSMAMFKRLDLSSSADKMDSMLQGIEDIAKLQDPSGVMTLARKLDDHLDLYRVTCPIGVLLCIFEARPEVVVNITALALKSGNAAILKGGKESKHTAAAIGHAIKTALASTKIPPDAIQLVESREEISSLLRQDEYIDLVVPRGSNALVKSIKQNTSIPVMGHADGICATFVDVEADIKKTVKVLVDAKTTYPAACNSLEQILIDERVLSSHLFPIAMGLLEAGVTLKCDSQIYGLLATAPEGPAYHRDRIQMATEADYDMEFLDTIVLLKVVHDVREAVKWINSHGSKHTDAIMTENKETAMLFMRGVDAAGVYWNASTRFSDGFRYGFGAEVGVSTNKTHARGPVGLDGLVIYKYWLQGSGDQAFCTKDYGVGDGKKAFLHKDLGRFGHRAY